MTPRALSSIRILGCCSMPSQISWELDKVELLGSGDKTDPSMLAQGQDISLCNGSERNKCAAEGLSREVVVVRAQASGSDEPASAHWPARCLTSVSQSSSSESRSMPLSLQGCYKD